MKRIDSRLPMVLLAAISCLPRTSAAQSAKPVARPAEAAAGRTTLLPTNAFDVRLYGAKADGTTDSTTAIQRAINAAQDVVEKNPEGGASVFIPSGRKPYMISAPIFVDGASIEIYGEGRGSQVRPMPYYGGPAFVLGVKRLNRYKLDAWRYRKDAIRVLDASASKPSVRNGLATRGESTVIFQAHPFQFGGPSPTYKGIYPDYWTETRQLTIEFCLSRPEGVTWEPGHGLLGIARYRDPSPWFVTLGRNQNEISLNFKTDDQTGHHYHRAFSPLPAGRGPWRITMQLDLEEGTYACWINGARTKPRFGVEGGEPALAFRPGLRFEKHDGVTPFVIGAPFGFVPFDGPVTDLELYGLRVSRGLVYRMNGPTESMVAMNWPNDDSHRYFEAISTPSVQTISLLPLDEPAGTVVKSVSQSVSLCGFWVPSKRARTTQNIVLRDLQIWSSLQQAVALGEVFEFRAENLHAGHGWQGIGSFALGCTYPVTLRGCRLYGYDTAYLGFQQILHATDTEIGQSGREGIRFCGGNSIWDNTLVTFSSPNTETFVQFLNGEMGQLHRINDMLVDNEGGGAKRAIIECEQGANCQTRLTIDGLDIAMVEPSASIVRLKGFGITSNFHASRVEIRNLTNADGRTKTALRVDGHGWFGTFDGSALVDAPVAGDGAAKITVTPPIGLPPTPTP